MQDLLQVGPHEAQESPAPRFCEQLIGQAGAPTTALINQACALGAGSDAELDEPATSYAHAVQDGKFSQANDILATLPNDSAEAIKRAAVSASSAAITMSMLALAVIALSGAIFAWVIIGRRRTPDQIEATHAAQL